MRVSGCDTSPVHVYYGYNTLQEVKKLHQKLQGTTDENTKKHLQEEISITQAKREIAESKQVR